MGCCESRYSWEFQTFISGVDESGLTSTDEFYMEAKNFESLYEIWTNADEERWKNLPPFSKRNDPEYQSRDLEYNVKYHKATENLKESLKKLYRIVDNCPSGDRKIKTKNELYFQAKNLYDNGMAEVEKKAEIFRDENEKLLIKDLGYDKKFSKNFY
jgi:hypothetical protein